MRTRIRSSRRAVVLAAVVALGAGALGGCSEDSGDEPVGKATTSAAGGGGGKTTTTLTLGLFGAFGYEEAGLYEQYMKLHPDIKIEQTTIQRNDNYYPPLLTHLGTGSGLSDIQGVEVANITEITTTQADKLMDLGKADGVRKDNFLDWKWAQATNQAGKTIGLGTDIGPTGICYRKDLFAKAGLPTDRAAVSALWAGDWRKYLEAGKAFKAKAPKGAAFVDSASGVMAVVNGSSAERFYDKDGKIVYKTSPAVKEGWDIAAAFAEEGLTAKLQQFTPAWDQAFANSAFATISCPPWMLGYIQDKAGAAGKGKWDMAEAPRPSSWGGAFLTVPEVGRNKAEAAKLAAWLTAPEQQATLFEKRGSFPSAKAAYALPAVADAKHAYFDNAPIGQLFTKAAEGIPLQILGPKDNIIAQNLADVGMLQVDQKGKSSKDGWNAAVKAIDNALDQ
ncbi:ABC transporter substrate-binding protein [Streptomyces sp. NPDC087658]|uniref:ABC transporter substrate-binding protein n=1 Tax=Streptomyces sp. NPDC087658 TaxID=3365800 RepID=UPI00381A3299